MALTVTSWLLLAVFVVGAGALLAVLVLWAVRPPRRAKRSYDGGTVKQVREYKTPGELVPVTEPEPEEDFNPFAVAPYQPQPAPVIRVDTGRLPVADNGPAWELERRTPHRTPSVESDFAVPALQAGMTALAVGVGAALVAWALAWSWRVPVAVCGAVFVLSWLWRLRIVDGLLWTVESIIRRDVTGDGQVGAPQTNFALVNPAEARTEAARAERTQADDTRRAELLDFLHRCYTVGTGVRAHDANNLGPVRDRYIRLRGTLMQLGIARWKNPDKTGAGWLLTVDEEQAAAIIMRHTT